MRRRSRPARGRSSCSCPPSAASGGERGRTRGEGANPGEGASPPIWRVQVRSPENELMTLMVNDRTGAVARLPAPLAGDRAAQWIRWIHEGSRGGPLWQFVVFLTGVFPGGLRVHRYRDVAARAAGAERACGRVRQTTGGGMSGVFGIIGPC